MSFFNKERQKYYDWGLILDNFGLKLDISAHTTEFYIQRTMTIVNDAATFFERK
jgi:hypothetical protein